MGGVDISEGGEGVGEKRRGRKRGERGGRDFLELSVVRIEPTLAPSVHFDRPGWHIVGLESVFRRLRISVALQYVKSPSVCKSKSGRGSKFLLNCPKRALFGMDGGVLVKYL